MKAGKKKAIEKFLFKARTVDLWRETRDWLQCKQERKRYWVTFILNANIKNELLTLTERH